jgi:hypothetical protein
MKIPGAPKQTYSVADVNAILRVAEDVREIRREYPEHNKMKAFSVVDGALLYTFKVLRGGHLQFVAREPAPEQMLREVAKLSRRQDASARKGKGSHGPLR